MDLPDLPEQKRQKTEQKITPMILDWFRNNHKGSCAIEIKATKTDTCPRSAVQTHQIKALLDAKSTHGLVHKIADNKRKNPFDAFMLQGVFSYIAVYYIKHRVLVLYGPENWQGGRYTDSGVQRITF